MPTYCCTENGEEGVKCNCDQNETSKVAANKEVMSDYGKEMWNWLKEHGEYVFEIEEVDDIMRIAEKHGLARRVTYDPEIHTNINGHADPGDVIWWYGSFSTASILKKL